MDRYVREDELIADAIKATRRSAREANRPTGTEKARTKEVADAAKSKAAQAAADVLAQAEVVAEIEQKANAAVVAISYEYALGSQTVPPTTGWSIEPPAWVEGSWLWRRDTEVRGNGSTSTGEPYLATGPAGSPGQDGTDGTPGSDGVNGQDGAPGADGRGVTSIVEEYYLSTSSTAQAGGSWATSVPAWVDGRFYWTRSKITYTDSSVVTTTPVMVSGGKGATGNTGATGTGVTLITRFYYLSSTQPAVPTASPPPAPWLTTEPAYTPGSSANLYEVTRTILTNGTWSYGPVSLSAAFTAAKQAYTEAAGSRLVADGLYAVIPSATQPTGRANGTPLNAGDQWWVIGTGATAGKFVGVRVYNGTSWDVRQIVADSILVPGSVGNVLIADGAIDGMTITGAELIGGKVEQNGNSPTAGTYPHPINAQGTGWYGVGLGDVSVLEGELSRYMQIQRPAGSPGRLAATYAIPNQYSGAQIQLRVKIRANAATKVWTSGRTLPAAGSGSSIAATTWLTITSPAFTVSGGAWVTVGFESATLAFIDAPEIIVNQPGTTKATLSHDQLQGPSLIWVAGGAVTGLYRSDGILLRQQNAISTGISNVSIDPTGVSFATESGQQPSFPVSIYADSGLVLSGGPSGTDVSFAGDTGWAQASSSLTATAPQLKNGWGNRVSTLWNGLWVIKLGNIVYLNGCLTKSSAYVSEEVLCTLPVGFRPPFALPIQATYWSTGVHVIIRPNGDVVTVRPGTAAEAAVLSMGGSYPVVGVS